MACQDGRRPGQWNASGCSSGWLNLLLCSCPACWENWRREASGKILLAPARSFARALPGKDRTWRAVSSGINIFRLRSIITHFVYRYKPNQIRLGKRGAKTAILGQIATYRGGEDFLWISGIVPVGSSQLNTHHSLFHYARGARISIHY
jgi:hypothetical protein